jgi:hypothetical protein
MAIIRGKLADIQYIANSAAAVYSNPASTKTFISGFTIFNGNTTAETVKLYNVPDSSGSVGTAGLSNQFFEQSLAPLETYIVEAPSDGYVLSDTNDSIQATTTTASKVTIQIHGTKDA